MNKSKSTFLELLRDRINMQQVPFSDRGSRILVFKKNNSLFLRLAERWVKMEANVGSYLVRAPILDELRLLDENGEPLDLEITTYPHAVFIQTRLGECWLSFQSEESLYLKLPPTRIGISFRVAAGQAHTDRRGGEFKGDAEHRRIPRNVAYTSNAHILSNTVTYAEQGHARVAMQLDGETDSAIVLNITPRLGLDRRVLPSAQVLDAAEERWDKWFAAAPTVEDRFEKQYYYAWWILGAGLLSPRFYLTREAMMPSMINYVGVWAWDAFFHALAYQYVDRNLAENQIRVLLDHQREDGMLADAIHDEGVIMTLELPGQTKVVEVTKPPLVAWTALKMYEYGKNRDFLEEVYEPITRWNAWWFEKNDDDQNGIMQYNHPNSSGLDDSPLWDPGMPVEAPDLNTYLVMQMDSLARIADILGLTQEANQWRTKAEELMARLVNYFWDEEAGVFWAKYNHEPIGVLTPFNLYPLMTGRLGQAQQLRLLEHLFNPEEFWLKYPLPTVAKNDPKYDPECMWRGPTWVNINYLFIDGLVRNGYTAEAIALRDRTLDLLLQQDDIYEYYNPETGVPPPKAASVFGWSSAVFVDLAIKASRGKII